METKKSFDLFSVGTNVMMKARASKAHFLCLPLFLLLYCDLLLRHNKIHLDIIAKEFVSQHGQKKWNQIDRGEIASSNKLIDGVRSVAVVLLTTDFFFFAAAKNSRKHIYLL